VTRVDFWVEKNGKISKRIANLHGRIAANLAELEVPELAAQTMQAQGADVLCWHERNAAIGALDTAGWRRRARMVGNKRIYGWNRDGHRNDVAEVLFAEFTESLRQTFPRRRHAVGDRTCRKTSARDALLMKSLA
jgi:hypothetical protein